jgi:hypothetical protein
LLLLLLHSLLPATLVAFAIALAAIATALFIAITFVSGVVHAYVDQKVMPLTSS